ncbi:uncharacterized protein DUF4439 [Arthrobacter sp. SLBN-112]|jgi:hypothetical protein|uniref:DUF4439 domain-containing protein n=1 Tax=Arthrobacter sp. SLBN-112 TaxID=2768452 RepID=UPI0011528E5D|nr:DUF4439 domain-containing protein [Arthrobacter sp. SLBN-112]TQJ40422.1 uncharacterized protein DUF4439 [Arthrobacter sp. SLBN-112]
MRPFRFAVLGLAVLVVLSLGFALNPAEKPAPAPPSFSERARAAALSEAMDLRAAGVELASAGPAESTAVEPVVTLLTIQARALSGPASDSSPASASPSSTGGLPSAGLSTAGAPAAGLQSAAELVQALANSGTARVKDAETADGGMARLLAGTGTAQLLAAGRLAAATGVPAPQGPAGTPEEAAAATATASLCPSLSEPAAAPKAAGPDAPASAGRALAAAITAEQQAAYGYQAALPRLAPAEAGPASEFLLRHKEQAAAAAERLRSACGAPLPQQPGYVLEPGFLAAPAAGLGKLEAATLAAYGDVVAVSQGQDRRWALSALQSAAGRAQRWGADPGPVPGLRLDIDQLPPLPAGAALPTRDGAPYSPAAP